jgi:pimeloyl-ACP methyl ester carboxylesterase
LSVTTVTTPTTTVEAPRWFGPPDHPLYGWVTSPSDGTSRGGVVLAQPIAREARVPRRAMRELALMLAARGFVCLRLDYEGVGDSSGAFDAPERDVAWTQSVAHAVDYLRSLGVPTVSAVGMRLGATIVGTAADLNDLGLHSVVLWDACDSGKAFLRQLSALEALRRTGVTVDSDGSLETAEFVFSKQACEEIRRLTLTTPATRSLAERVLVLTREDRVVSDKLRARLQDEKVDWESMRDQGAMLDDIPLDAKLAFSTMRRITAWLADEAPPAEPLRHLKESPTATVSGVGDAAVTERFVQLGPNELFGVVTEPAGGGSGPWFVMLNVANEEHTGPSRQWVDLARHWAEHGLRSVRVDLTGLGDSPRVIDRDFGTMFDLQWLTDTEDVAAALSPDDPSNTVFVGLCSGAYLAVEAGLSLHTRGVCIINPPIGLDLLSGIATLERSPKGSVRTVAVRMKEGALRLRWIFMGVWQVARVVRPKLFNRNLMAEYARSGSDLYVLASRDDVAPSERAERFGWFFAGRLVNPKNYDVHFVPDLDHSMHVAVGRERAIEMLDRHVIERFATTGSKGDSDAVER